MPASYTRQMQRLRFQIGTLAILMALSSSAGGGVEPEPGRAVLLTVDAGHVGPPYTPAWNYFGADEPNFIYAPNGVKLLHELSALSPSPVYMRVHNLLTTGDGSGSLKWGSTNAYTEDAQARPVYDWTVTDRIFDAFQNAQVRPLVEIGFMPQALSTHPSPTGTTSPPSPTSSPAGPTLRAIMPDGPPW